MLCRIIENRGRKWLKVMLELILGCGLNPDGVRLRKWLFFEAYLNVIVVN